MAHFYSHLIQIEDLVIALGELDLQDHHKEHLGALADSTIHHTILELIFSKLSSQDKVIFLKMLNKNPEDPKLIDFLKERIDGIEVEIQKAARNLKTELHEDIKGASKQKDSK